MNNLKDLRNKSKKSQQEVADYLGVSRQAYSHYENGKREPDLETLLKLGEYFECSVDEILRPSNEKKAPIQQDERPINDDDIKFALWGTREIDDDVLDAVKTFAKFARENRRDQ
jgi:transcriptional regulator with XRE-family HTH domain